MAIAPETAAVFKQLKRVWQVRQYRPDPVPQEALDELLEVARWTGSANNIQPWRFIVINDKDILRQISQIRPAIHWVATAPLAIALALNGAKVTTEAYDEGRVSERLMIGAKLLGLGAGTGWFGDDEQQAKGKRILGIPDEIHARSVVTIGYPVTSKDPRPNPATGGRKPASDVIRYNRYD